MDREEIKKLIIETIKEYNKSGVFTDFKTVDTPTDAYSIVNKKFVDDLILDDLSDVAITSGAQGDVLYRGASAWNNLAPGTNRQTLQTAGASANPSWAPSPQAVMTAQGDVLYASAANTLARLAPGTSGQFLKTQGAAANPTWDNMPVRRISAFYTDVTVGNTTTETDLMNFTLNGGSLGTTGILWGKILIRVADATNGGGGQTITWRLYYGATNASDVVQITTSFDQSVTGFFDFYIIAKGATNSQDLDFRFFATSDEVMVDPTAVGEVPPFGSSLATIDAAIDSTVNQTVKITAQWGAALATNSLSARNGFALLLT